MKNIKVCKFGGSSVRDAEAMSRCSRILQKRPENRLVIISATYNTTNELEELAGISLKSLSDAREFLSRVMERHTALAKELKCSNECFSVIDELGEEANSLIDRLNALGRYDLALMDQIYSLGERLSSSIFADFLSYSLNKKVIYYDVRNVLITDEKFGQANPDLTKTNFAVKEKLNPLFDAVDIVVTQGFVGSTTIGQTTTLGREGSDYSATLLGEALGALEIQIWTDVPGIASADPSRIKNARFISEMCFEEAAVLARNGAKVLFPNTLSPAERANIPVFVGSSLNSELGGTLIKKYRERNRLCGLATTSNRLTISGVGVDSFKEEIFSFLESFNPNVVISTFHELTLEFEEAAASVAYRTLHGYLFEE